MYRAERFLYGGPSYATLTDAQAAADAITTSAAWTTVVPDIDHVTLKLTVKPAYAATTYRGKRLITVADHLLPTGQFSQRLLLHELAHIATPVGGHGPVFRARYLWLLETFAHNPSGAPASWFPAEQAARLRFGLAVGNLRVATGGLVGVASAGQPKVRWIVPDIPTDMSTAAKLVRARRSHAAVCAALAAR